MIARRHFLQSAGALVISFAFSPLAAPEQPAPRADGPAGAPDASQLDAWLSIDAAGLVTLFSGKVELGTGVQTALSQIVAEELDVPVARIHVVQGETGRTPNQGMTVGSKTLQVGAVQVRRAAADARRTLLDLASTHLSMPAAALTVADGIVHPRAAAPADRRVSYAELIGGRPFSRTLPAASVPVQTKAPKEYRVVGQSVQRVDLPAKIAGTHEYVHNVRLPGMLHARVVRPPAIGATLASLDDASVRALPGIVSIVRKGNFVGIVAEREEQAIAAARALAPAITWTPPAAALPPVDTLDEVIRATPVTERVITETGDRVAAMAGAKTRVEAAYSMPFQSHVSTGPSCALADVRSGEATIWSGTQGSYMLRDAIAGLLEMPPARVKVIWTEASGCYGHNGSDDCAADAAVLSREVGRPVRLQWSRQDEHAWAPKGPAMLMDARAALDASGRIAAWDYAVTSPTHSTRPGGRAANLLAAQLMGQQPQLGTIGGDRNARHSYSVPNDRVSVRWMQQSVLRPSSFRGLGAPANVFAIESFMDELAAAAGADPVVFRLRHLNDPRAVAVVQRVAELARWQPRTASSRAKAAASNGRVEGRGMAFLQYENVNTYVAAVTDILLDRATGAVRVTRIFVAHDCGLVVNPDGLRNQIEGGILQGVSRALKEQVRWEQSAITSVDWQSYPILTFADVPETFEIALIDRPDQPALGGGEAAHCAAPAAVANAIADATGLRLRALPFTPERVKRGLAAMSPNGRG